MHHCSCQRGKNNGLDCFRWYGLYGQQVDSGLHAGKGLYANERHLFHVQDGRHDHFQIPPYLPH